MKKYFLFFAGFITAIILTVCIGYYILKEKATISSGSDDPVSTSVINSNARVELVDLTVEDFLTYKKSIKKQTLVNFWASWCKPCVEEIPFLIDYCKKNNIDLVFISSDKNSDKQKLLLISKMQELNISKSFLIKVDGLTDVMGRNLYFKFLDGIEINYDKANTGIPFFILISKNGEVEKSFIGIDKTSLYSSYLDSKIKTQN